MVTSLQDELDNLVTKLNIVLDTLVELPNSPEEVFVYNEIHFGQKERVVSTKFQHTLVKIL